MESTPPAGLARRKTPRQARSAVTVDAIFEGTVQVLLSGGHIRDTSPRGARRAGGSGGTLYRYFPNKRALLYGALERHLAMIVGAVEAACLAHRGAPAGAMAEAVVESYLRAKMAQCEVSSALYLIVIELDARDLVEAATRRAEEAIARMLSSASDVRFADPRPVSETLLAAVSGAVRSFFERASPPTLGGETATHLSIMCRSYLTSIGGGSPPNAAPPPGTP